MEAVTLNGIAHTYPDDFDILLQSPTGTDVILMSDAGGGDNIAGIDYTIMDGASAFSDGSMNPSGTYTLHRTTAVPAMRPGAHRARAAWYRPAQRCPCSPVI
ncbi:MAG: hypothetical protein R2818_12925 [Flavobacteriales bacterium]